MPWSLTIPSRQGSGGSIPSETNSKVRPFHIFVLTNANELSAEPPESNTRFPKNQMELAALHARQAKLGLKRFQENDDSDPEPLRHRDIGLSQDTSSDVSASDEVSSVTERKVKFHDRDSRQTDNRPLPSPRQDLRHDI